MTASFSENSDPCAFLERLYSSVDSGYLEIRGIDPTGRLPKRSQSEWFQINSPSGAHHALAFARSANAAGYDVFLGVNPRINRGLEDEDVLSGCAFFADIDGLASLEAAEAKLEEVLEFPIKIDAAVFSGSGLHIYSFLKEVRDPADAPEWELYLRGLKAFAALFGGDPVCCNPSRVLRFPGSFSHKRGVKTRLWISEQDTQTPRMLNTPSPTMGAT